MTRRRLKLLSANIQAGSSTRRFSDYATRSWSHVLPAGNKRGSLDAIAQLAGQLIARERAGGAGPAAAATAPSQG